jgi:uncharacterized protein
MDITPELPGERQVIQAYGEGRFRISDVVHEGSVIVLPERTLAWSAPPPEAMTVEALAAVLEAEPRIELLLLGCGPRAVPLASALRQALRVRGIAVEVMDTGAACRTYNVLAAEERRVAAALLAVG